MNYELRATLARLMECGNTEAEGFLCRFHLATEKYGVKKDFPRGKRPARFSGKSLFEAVLPQGKAVNVAYATVSPHSEKTTLEAPSP